MPFVETADGTDIFYNDWRTGKPVGLIHGRRLNADCRNACLLAFAR